jgi:heptosyltransferase-2
MSGPLSPKRVLVIRLDRLGDVVLSTPVLSALRQHFPHAHIAMMVRPPCVDVVEGHPAVNGVVAYDKAGAQRSAPATAAFARRLRGEDFDTALVLHPSNRSHWIPWLAGIPVRVGYDRKCGWLLTHRVPHRKQEGAQHEAAYALDLLRVFGIEPPPPRPSIPVHEAAVRQVQALLEAAAVPPSAPLVAVHPSASCISKRWMPERFAAVADRLQAEHGVTICLIAGPEDAPIARQVAQAAQRPIVDLAGRLSVAQLAALLRRCRLLVSNDSGPVHVAAAVGTPVVDLFGRNQRGLSPARWGPLGPGHVVLHKEVGCVTCLAHNCDINFLCLTEISVEEVYEAAAGILGRSAGHESLATP